MPSQQDAGHALPSFGSQALPSGEYPGLATSGSDRRHPMQEAQPSASAQRASGRTGDSGHSSLSSKAECQEQQCAEEECDPEECGDEGRPPRNDNYTCGVDRRPLLPFALITSTMFGGLCMLMKQRPLLRQLLGGSASLTGFFFVLYSITLIAMTYCTLCDPGQLQRQDQLVRQQLLEEGANPKQELPMPKRAHKAWLYALPIRRYDHYCRWLTNVIGLLNHREFVIMCIGLVMIAGLGALVDLVLLIVMASRSHWSDMAVLLLHLMYSLCILGLGGPILRLHIGFISRNELAHDWKKNLFYVIHSRRTAGKVVLVNDLSDDEFNERFDSFCYDETRNPWDEGMRSNCWSFWCTSRWTPGQLGDF